MHSGTIRWKDAVLSIRRYDWGIATHKYSVELLEGNWPTDKDLITLCDGNIPPNDCSFGGHVRKSERHADVSVYVD